MSMGGGGGGGTSGTVVWPTYFQTWHEAVLGTGSELATASSDLVDIMNAAIGASPFTGVNAYVPDTDLGVVDTAMTKVTTLAEALDPDTDWHSYVTFVSTTLTDHVFSTAELGAAETAFNAAIDADYVNVTLPRFQRGMQDANAVMSSAYVVGTALLAAEVTRKKATFSSDLRIQSYRDKTTQTMAGVESLIKLANQTYDFRRSVVATLAETKRIKLVAKKEETDTNTRIDELDAKWDLEVFTYGGNFLAAGHGGVQQSGTKASPVQSALGGAMSGAAMGSMVMPGWGTAIGGIMGLMGGLFS